MVPFVPMGRVSKSALKKFTENQFTLRGSTTASMTAASKLIRFQQIGSLPTKGTRTSLFNNCFL